MSRQLKRKIQAIISFLLWDYHVDQVLCDLGASINFMPKVMYETIDLPHFYMVPTAI
jgi:hypothetical protein